LLKGRAIIFRVKNNKNAESIHYLEEAQRMKVGMVSTHPSSSGGVSNYTKNLMNFLQKEDINLTLISNRFERNEQDKSVITCWNEGILYPFQIFKNLTKIKSDLVHIQHEFFLFGGLLSSLLFPVLLILIKILRIPTVVTLHGVIPLSAINQRFLKENEISGPPLFLRLGIKLLTMSIVFLSNAIIVHENFFAKTLKQNYGCSPKKIYIIPHGVEKIKTKITQTHAKEKLQLIDKVVIFFFGYLARYKGLETLVEGFSLKASKNPKWFLIIGGGEHPRLKKYESYRRYLSKLKEEATYLASKAIIFTGFIPDEKLHLFFSAADIIVFPYFFTMSSSGPLAKAFTYEKPIIVSDAKLFTDTIPFKEIIFNKDSPSNLGDKLELIIEDSRLKNRVTEWVKKVARKNSWRNVGIQTALLYNQLIK